MRRENARAAGSSAAAFSAPVASASGASAAAGSGASACSASGAVACGALASLASAAARSPIGRRAGSATGWRRGSREIVASETRTSRAISLPVTPCAASANAPLATASVEHARDPRPRQRHDREVAHRAVPALVHRERPPARGDHDGVADGLEAPLERRGRPRHLLGGLRSFVRHPYSTSR
jgi:hypothetical protein